MTASHSGAYEVCVEMVPIGGEHSACAATYVAADAPDVSPVPHPTRHR